QLLCLGRLTPPAQLLPPQQQLTDPLVVRGHGTPLLPAALTGPARRRAAPRAAAGRPPASAAGWSWSKAAVVRPPGRGSAPDTRAGRRPPAPPPAAGRSARAIPSRPSACSAPVWGRRGRDPQATAAWPPRLPGRSGGGPGRSARGGFAGRPGGRRHAGWRG